MAWAAGPLLAFTELLIDPEGAAAGDFVQRQKQAPLRDADALRTSGWGEWMGMDGNGGRDMGCWIIKNQQRDIMRYIMRYHEIYHEQL